MNQKLIALSHKREQLVAQSAAQRKSLAESVEALRATLTLIDQGVKVVEFMKQHPVLMACGGAILFKLFSGRFLKLVNHGWVAWELLNKFKVKFLG